MQRTYKYYTEPVNFNIGTWIFHNDSVYIRQGTSFSGKIAAFDFDNTLVQSDSGIKFMRTADDWTPTIRYDQLQEFFKSLTDDFWTIVIFSNQLENNKRFTEAALARINNFVRLIQRNNKVFNPWCFVSIANDINRKPNRGMWDLFLQLSVLNPNEASFYCGDAYGPGATNPLYRWGTFDRDFATSIGLTYYTPEEMLGTYEPLFTLNPDEHRAILIMAAHPAQYQQYITEIMDQYPQYVVSNLADADANLKAGRNVIIVGERFATIAGRHRAVHFGLPKDGGTIVFMFTRPIGPFITEQQYRQDDAAIRGYANALDYHPSLVYLGEYNKREPYRIIVIN